MKKKRISTNKGVVVNWFPKTTGNSTYIRNKNNTLITMWSIMVPGEKVPNIHEEEAAIQFLKDRGKSKCYKMSTNPQKITKEFNNKK